MECKPEQQAMMQEIMAADFMANELQLYLDTHPDCTQALKLFSEACEKSCRLKKEYQEKFCPIVACGNAGKDKWRWNDSPWTWQK